MINNIIEAHNPFKLAKHLRELNALCEDVKGKSQRTRDLVKANGIALDKIKPGRHSGLNDEE